MTSHHSRSLSNRPLKSPLAAAPHKLRLRPWLAVLLGLCVLLIAFLLLFNWDWLRGPVERYVSAKIQREFSISSLDVEWGLTPTVVMEDVKFANAEWATDQKPMAQIGKLSFSVSLRDLWEKKLLVPRAAMSRADFLFEKAKDDRKNWVLKEPRETREPSPLRIGSISVDSGTLRFVDHGEPFDVRIDVSTFEPEAREKAKDAAAAADNRKFTTRYTFAGTYHDAPFKGEARTGEVLSFQKTDIPFPIQGTLDANTTLIKVDGTVADLAEISGIDVKLAIEGKTLASCTHFFCCRCPPRLPMRSKAGSSRKPIGTLSMTWSERLVQRMSAARGLMWIESRGRC